MSGGGRVSWTWQWDCHWMGLTLAVVLTAVQPPLFGLLSKPDSPALLVIL